jgi:hypothetical protein
MPEDPTKFHLKIDPKHFKVRPINPEGDINFLLSSWLKSYRRSEFAQRVSDKFYYPHHEGMLRAILTDASNNVTVLCDSEDDTNILGYIVYSLSAPIIYYTYVKHDYRKLGLGRYMYEAFRKGYGPDVSVICSHKPKKWSRYAQYLNLEYNPYITSAKQLPAPKETKDETN